MKDQIQKLSESQAVQTEILGRLEKNLSILSEHLLGNGKLGLITRVDRLEVWDRMKNKVLWSLSGLIAGGIISWLSYRF